MSRPHSWMPVSPCGQRCLPPAGAVPTVARTRRLLAVGALLLLGALLVGVLPALGPGQRERTLRAWYKALLRALRIQLEVTGGDRFADPAVGILVVSNHTSWLDLVALGAVQPLRMVAKQEVGRWPLIGPLARRLGTIFVDREHLSALPGMVAAVARALADGAAVGAFPEGTTWCGLASGRFRPAVFQAAVDTAAPVRPVALRYRLAGGGPTTTVASFVGPTSLWEALVRVAGVQGLVIEVDLFPLLQDAYATRHILAARAEIAVGVFSSVLGTDRTGECPVDHGAGSGSQILIEEMLMVPWYSRCRTGIRDQHHSALRPMHRTGQTTVTAAQPQPWTAPGSITMANTRPMLAN